MKKAIIQLSLFSLFFQPAFAQTEETFVTEESLITPYVCNCEVGYNGKAGVSMVMYKPSGPVVIEHFNAAPEHDLANIAIAIKRCVMSRTLKIESGICIRP